VLVWHRRKLWPSAFAVPLIVASLWYWGTQAALAQMMYAEATILLPGNQLAALDRNWQAVRTFPPDQMARMQLFKTAVRANELEKITVSPETMRSAFGISTSAAPNHAGVLLARLHYLHHEGRCEPECSEILNRLSRQASRVQEVAELLEKL